jgi:BirA family transcriptional regulator, biotin operon repressor / biotin---[acetyl-CoA-carboxylase] ligase
VTTHRFATLPSTNSALAELAEKGAPEGTAVRAEEQTAGKGRSGRGWHSPPGNLYLSVLLRPPLDASRLSRLPLLASLALLRALRRPGVPFALKWPNDLLLDGRKAAGVLLEARTQGEETLYVVVGVGVNFALDRGSLPPELAGRVASLSEFGGWRREEVAEALVPALLRAAGEAEGPAWERARAEWWESAWKPCSLAVRTAGGVVSGRPTGVDENGGLVLDTPGGLVAAGGGELVEEA